MSSISGNIVTPVEPAKVTEPGGEMFDAKPNTPYTRTHAYISRETSRRVSVQIIPGITEGVVSSSVKFQDGTDTAVLEPGASAPVVVSFTTASADGPFAVNYSAKTAVVA